MVTRSFLISRWLLVALLLLVNSAHSQVRVDIEAFGTPLGGWTKRDGLCAEYRHSGSMYRTYKPEITATPDGGLFVSVRIDHVRGWLSSDDHATLEVTYNAKGHVISAQSNIAIQGRSISSDVIRSGNEASKKLAGADRAVQIGTDMVADLSAKLLREKLVEAGRVSFPAVLRHNFNMLFQAVKVDKLEPEKTEAEKPTETAATTPPPEIKPEQKAYQTPSEATIPVTPP
ncbi:MAG: hypothetical protein EAZ42_02710 [Verrucomicrobia bacterium]|nr:MAG: hypothetical protein EAZ42_02710 [Verrucomicrobiota bacterium]